MRRHLWLLLTLLSIASGFSQRKWSGEPAASAVSDSDYTLIVQGGVNKRAAFSLIRSITASQISDATTVGRAILSVTNPSAIRFLRVNADNTVTLLNAADFLTAIGGGSGTDNDAIHDNVSGEISAVTDKATPVAADHLLIEDSAASDAKKDITIGSQETALEGVIDLQDLQGAVVDGQVPNTITVDLATTATNVADADKGDISISSGVWSVDANSITLGTDTTGNYAAGDAEAGAATTGDSATGFFSAGQIERARGGTAADTSAYGAGLLGSDGSNNTIDVDTQAKLETAIGSAGLATDAEVAAAYQPLDADLTDLADGTLTASKLDQTANFDWTGEHTFDADGVRIDDTNASHQLIFTPGSNLTANRVFTITTGDSARTLTFTADATIGGTTSGTNTGDQTITLTSDVTGSGTGSFATTIANDTVTFAKFQNITSDRLLGRDTASSGDTEEITVGGGLEFTGSTGIQRSALTGNVTASAGSNSTTIANNVVTGAMIALGSDASGDTMYYNGTDWVRLAKASDGDVLKLSSGVPAWGTDNTAGSPTWDTIGDASGNGSVAFLNTTQSITSTLDNGIVLELTDTDADAAADTTLFKISHNDGADANVIYLLMQGDKDGTPTSDFLFTQSGFTSLLPINPPAESYGSGWNSDTGAAQKDNIYDTLHVGDTDDDGKADLVDLGTAGIVRTTSGGVISSAELSGEATTSASNAVTIADSVAVSSWNLTTPTITTSVDLGSAGVRLSDDGDGAITFLGLGNGSDEDLTINLDDTSNTATVSSSTGLNNITFSSIDLTIPTANVTTVTATTITGSGGGITVDATGFNGNLATTDNTMQEIAQKLDDLSTGGATNWTDIADASGDTTIALGAHETDFTSTIDASGEAAWTMTMTDADVANDSSAFDIKFNDGADANAFYLRMIGDADGTPTNDYLFAQSGATFTLPLSLGTSGVFTAGTIELGAASDTTIARSGAGDLTVEGNGLYRAGGTDVAVADGGTGLSSGTSGGVLAYTASGTLASSAALAANAIVIGGGAGAAPSTTTTGSGVLTALGLTANTGGGVVTANGIATLSAKSFGNGSLSSGEVKILEDTDAGSNYAAFTVPSLAFDTVYVLPPDDGEAGEQLQSDGNGTLTWESASGLGPTAINDIADATADGLVQQSVFEMDFTAGIDSAGKAMWTLTNTDADTFNDTSLIDLQHNDGADANVYYLRMIGDADGTPTNDFLFNQTGATFTLPLSLGTTGVFTTGTIELGAASDTTLSRASAGAVNIEGVAVDTASNTLTLTNKTLTAPKFADLGFIADANGNEMLVFDTGASAVNYIKLLNSSTGNPVRFSADGDDSGISIQFEPKGGGDVSFLATTTQASRLRIYEDADNGINYGEFATAESMTGDRTYRFPDSATTIPIFSQLITVSGPSAARTWTVPDANFTAARTDAAQTFTGAQSFGNGSTSTGDVRILEDTDAGSNYASFTVPSLAANTVYLLPPDDGDAGEQLQTDGNGTLTWEAAGGAGATAINDIGDATADGSVAQAGFEMDFTSTLDSNGKAIWTITNTDADTAADTAFIDLRHNDGADANVFYLRMIGDNDGTPTNDYLFSETAATFTLPLSLGTSGVFTTGTIELGAASDTTLARVSAGVASIEGVNIVTTSATQTLTNKSITTPTTGNGATGPGYIDFLEDTDNGSNRVRVIGPSSTADVDVTLPAATDTLVGKATTDTLTNKTLDGAGTGNVLKFKSLPQFTSPLRVQGTNSTIGTTATAVGYGLVTFAHDQDEANNWAEWRIVVPADWDTGVDPTITLLDLIGADTGARQYVASVLSVNASASATGSPGTAIDLNVAADGSGASGDVEIVTGTLTGWGAAMTPGRLMIIRIARDGDQATQDASTVNSTLIAFEISYGATQ